MRRVQLSLVVRSLPQHTRLAAVVLALCACTSHPHPSAGKPDATSADAGAANPSDAATQVGDAAPGDAGRSHTDGAAPLPDASARDASKPKPDGGTHEAPKPLPLRAISVGYEHACAIAASGVLYCWGQNDFGQLGTGDILPQGGPVAVGTRKDWTSVSAGRFHTCAIAAGALYCWGSNDFGQAAGAQATELDAPAQVSTPSVSWNSVSAGDWHTCAIDSTGQLYCWGYNLLGRLGDGHGLGDQSDPAMSVTAPLAIDVGASYLAVDAGEAHSCAIRQGGALYCFGLDDRGQLGFEGSRSCSLNGASSACELAPRLVSGSVSWTQIAVGGSHSCGLDAAGLLYCFGANDAGQLGSGDKLDKSAPTRVAGTFAAISTGRTHSCALRSDHHLACFGDNENAQLGLSDMSVTTPKNLDGAWTGLSAGALGSCAVGTAHNGYCWGLAPYAGTASPTQLVP